MEDGQRQRDVDGPHRVHGPDGDAPHVHPAQALQLALRCVHLGQDPARAGHQHLAGRGDGDVTGRTLYEAQPRLLLQPADLLGERWLRYVLTGGGTGEVPLLRQRHQVPELR